MKIIQIFKTTDITFNNKHYVNTNWLFKRFIIIIIVSNSTNVGSVCVIFIEFGIYEQFYNIIVCKYVMLN